MVTFIVIRLMFARWCTLHGLPEDFLVDLLSGRGCAGVSARPAQWQVVLVTGLKTLVPCAAGAKPGTVSTGPMGTGVNSMRMHESGTPNRARVPAKRSGLEEVRCAVRFPLALPLVLSTGNAEVAALTRNVSASGVLFSLDRSLSVGLGLNFSMRMPHAILGTPHDVLVHCKGRVVRCSSSPTEHLAAATIDEYRFAEQ